MALKKASSASSQWTEGANAKAIRALMIGVAALVVLSVSGYGTVIYIQLMGKVFPTGPLLMACYMGAGANLLLMLVLLVGKFVWFRPGAHEVASWIVTGVELIVAIMNMMLAYALASGQALSSFMAAWNSLAPISPVFSMVGAIVLIMTSTELRHRHHEQEIQEKKERAERIFDLAMHEAEIETKYQYLGFVKQNLVAELNSPDRQLEMKDHAAMLVSEVLSGMSGLSSVPRLSRPALPAGSMVNGSALPTPFSPLSSASDTLSEDAENWLARANERVEQERARRASFSSDAPLAPASAASDDADDQEGGDARSKKK